jgi:ABC-2 type transport system permease protein
MPQITRFASKTVDQKFGLGPLQPICAEVGKVSRNPMTSAPIADLSYRGYDGPLESPQNRWWVIARMLIKLTFKKKVFWVWTFLAGIGFYFNILALYIIESTTSGPFNQTSNEMFKRIVWKDIFVQCFGWMQLFLLFIAIVAGAGAIANDNRANALLVYLSKPCRKIDYLLGKWTGLAILVSAVTLIHFTLFYGYCLMSYRDYGFFTKDPLLYPKLILIAGVTGIVHASLMIGVSSMFNQGRLAGATYSGLYFITYFFTTIIAIIRATSQMEGGPRSFPVLDALYYGSIDGINIGMSKVILHTSGSTFFQNPRQRQPVQFVPPPNGLYFPIFVALIIAFFLWIAWKRIRAVEVIA